MKRIQLPTIAICLALGACGLEGDKTPPSVAEQSPAAGQAELALDTTVEVVFSEALREDHISVASLVVTDASITEVAGTLSYDAFERRLVWAPVTPLKLATTYTVSLGEGLSDLAGNSLAAQQWTFSTRDGAWSMSDVLSNLDSDAGNPKVAMDNEGFGLAVWLQSDGLYTSVHASHYVPDLGWEAPGVIDLFSLGDALAPVLSLDPESGAAVVAWLEAEDGVQQLWANFYQPAVGWGTPMRADGSPLVGVRSPAVHIGNDGSALIAFVRSDAVDTVMVNAYSPDSGWGEAVPLQTSTTENAQALVLAGSSSGRALVAWTQIDAMNLPALHAATRSPTGTWSEPLRLDDASGAAIVGGLALRMNSSGEALLAWTQGGLDGANLRSRRHRPVGGWAVERPLEAADALISATPALVLHEDGSALALWPRGATDTRFRLFAAEADADGVWSGATVFAQSAGNDLASPAMAMNAEGTVHALWLQFAGAFAVDTTARVMQRRWRPLEGWNEAQRLDSAPDALSVFPGVGVDAEGRAVAVWQRVPDGEVSRLEHSVFR